jgi:excisionase family DNA binding protein
MALNSPKIAAQRLDVKPECIYNWLAARKIPFVRVGRLVKISDETIEDIICQGTVPAIQR